jgi:hypothetical protein
MAPHLRIARPVTDLARSTALYCRGLDLLVLGRFEDHAGFDGVMLGAPDGGYHFEFTRHRAHPVAPAPTVEDLVVFYLPGATDWADGLRQDGGGRLPPRGPVQSILGASRPDLRGSRRLPRRTAERQGSWLVNREALPPG